MTERVKPGPNAWTRRQFAAALLGAASLPLLGRTGRAGESLPRIAVLDWAWAETLLALGLAPAAVAEAPLYGARVVSPALAEGTVDLGLRSWPNMELLHAFRPDLIVTQTGYGVPAAQLEPLAPVLSLPLYSLERQPLKLGQAGLEAIAARLQRQSAATAYLEDADQQFAACRDQLRSYDGRPLLILKFASDRLADIYGPGSLFHDVLSRLGLSSAWQRSGSHWGFSTAGLDAIAAHQEARIVIIEPGPPEALAASGLWRAIPAVRAGRVISIPPVWVFGALPSALRFAGILTKALQTS
ncbi:ABC transporter substrate-binding protein [Pannonibacter phragmitetus]|uniref:ABC transporter substrate-binding protein n=1 Tax=Pannonibacter phragmitetus TaxID=121719 RepID=UPI003D2F4352